MRSREPGPGRHRDARGPGYRVSSKTTGTSLALTVASPVAAGDSIIVTFAMNYDASGAVTCSDNRGNSYAVDVDAAQVPSGGGSRGVRTVVCRAHDIQNFAAGGTITVAHPSVAARAMAIQGGGRLHIEAVFEFLTSA